MLNVIARRTLIPDDKDKVVPCHPGGPDYRIGPLLDDFLVSQEPAAHLPHEIPGKIRVIAQEAVKLLLGDHNEVGFVNTYYTSGTSLARQKSQVAEVFARSAHTELPLDPVLVPDENPNSTGTNNIESIRRVPFFENNLARPRNPALNCSGKLVELFRGQIPKNGILQRNP